MTDLILSLADASDNVSLMDIDYFVRDQSRPAEMIIAHSSFLGDKTPDEQLAWFRQEAADKDTFSIGITDNNLLTLTERLKFNTLAIYGLSYHFSGGEFMSEFNPVNIGFGLETDHFVIGGYVHSFYDAPEISNNPDASPFTPFIGTKKEGRCLKWLSEHSPTKFLQDAFARFSSKVECGGMVGLVDYGGNLPKTEIIGTLGYAAQAYFDIKINKSWELSVGFIPSFGGSNEDDTVQSAPPEISDKPDLEEAYIPPEGFVEIFDAIAQTEEEPNDLHEENPSSTNLSPLNEGVVNLVSNGQLIGLPTLNYPTARNPFTASRNDGVNVLTFAIKYKF